MSFGSPWGSVFYTGGGASSLVPSRFPLAIAGRPYLIDTRQGSGAVNGDIPVQRPQADTQASPSEATLSTEGLWRRTVESFHDGAGQAFYDRLDGDPFRYHASAGVDPWTRWQASLLPATTRSLTSANAGLHLAVAAGRLYVTDGQIVRYTADLTTWTAVTGNPAVTATSIASDGSTVYVAYGASGVYTVAAGAAAMVSYVTGTVDVVGWGKGRLFAITLGASAVVYNIVAAGALPAALLTVARGTFPYEQAVAEGPAHAYLVGSVGDKTRIWRTAIKDDATGLDAPIPAGELPDGQVARSACGFLGSVLFVGTDDRVWACDYDGAGNLVVRGNFDTSGPVNCFEPQDRFVWFGDADASLSRLDTATNVAADPSAFVPAHAPDLTAALSGAVSSVATFGDLRAFAVAGRGVYAETAAKVASGTLETGAISFGIGDLKNVLFADVRHEALAVGDSVAVEVSKDGGPFTPAGASTTVGAVAATVPLGQLLAQSVALRLTLTGDPVLRSLTVRAAPAPVVGEVWQVPLLLFDKTVDLNGQEVRFDVPTERAYLKALRSSRTAVLVQHGEESFTAIVDAMLEWVEESMAYGDDGGWLGFWNGRQTIRLKVVSE